jgi:hypothetical protein
VRQRWWPPPLPCELLLDELLLDELGCELLLLLDELGCELLLLLDELECGVPLDQLPVCDDDGGGLVCTGGW